MKKLFIILFVMIAAIPAYAQHPQQGNGQQGWSQRFNPEEFMKRMEGYISMKAGLTPEESEKFFPVYREFKNKQRELTFKEQALKRTQPANDHEYEKVVNEIACLSVQIAKLEQTYYPKFCKLIPAKKVFKVLQAENDFHRDMIQVPQMPRWGGNGQSPQQQRRPQQRPNQ